MAVVPQLGLQEQVTKAGRRESPVRSVCAAWQQAGRSILAFFSLFFLQRSALK